MKQHGYAFVALCLATTQPAAADPPASLAKGPLPIGNASSWITDDDYPRMAILQNRQGVTQFRLTIDRQGMVQDCVVVETSGSIELDSRTCTLLTKRAQFKPAVNEAGEPTSGFYRSSIRWHMPRDSGSPDTYSTTSYIVETDGRLSECKIEIAVEGRPGVPRPIDCAGFGPLSEGYRDAQNRPVRKRVFTIVITKVTDAEPQLESNPSK